MIDRRQSEIARFRIVSTHLALIAFSAMLVFCLSAGKSLADELDVQTRSELQLSLQSYIDNKTEDGLFPYFNSETGEIEHLILKNLHPAIFKKQDYYLMCADFMDSKGDAVLIDYIVRRHRNGYRVEQEIRGKRSFLTKMFNRVY